MGEGGEGMQATLDATDPAARTRAGGQNASPSTLLSSRPGSHHHHPHALSPCHHPTYCPQSESESLTLGWGRHCLADSIHSICSWGALQSPLVPGRVVVPFSQVFSCVVLVCDYCSCF